MPEPVKTPVKRPRKPKQVAKVEEVVTPLKGFTPKTTNLSDRSIGKSLSNAVSSGAEIIEELAIDGKKGLRTLGKVFDYASVELDGLYVVSFTENLNKLVALGHSPEVANQMLIDRANAI